MQFLFKTTGSRLRMGAIGFTSGPVKPLQRGKLFFLYYYFLLVSGQDFFGVSAFYPNITLGYCLSSP
jgi:hypothetical protein